MRAVVTLKKGEGRTIKSGGLWVFDNEIDSVMGGFENGDLVDVHDFDGYPMGIGFINRNSKIRVRMLTRDAKREIHEEFFRMRIERAWDYRKKTVDTSSCRLVFGDADFLPGLVIDKFSDVLVVQSDSPQFRHHLFIYMKPSGSIDDHYIKSAFCGMFHRGFRDIHGTVLISHGKYFHALLLAIDL